MVNHGGYTIQAGDDVFGADGDKVGTVVTVEPDYLVVEKGWFFPTDYYVPVSAVASAEEGRVYLNVTKEIALSQGWDVEPAAAVSEGDVGRVATTLADGTLRVPVYEEELTARTVPRDVAGARIEKMVVAEEQVLEVPVTEERVRVVRRTVDRPVDAAATDVFEEVVVDVPVRTQEVAVDKRVHVAEEVEIQKDVVQRTEEVRETVRREEVRVTDAGEGILLEDEEPSR